MLAAGVMIAPAAGGLVPAEAQTDFKAEWAKLIKAAEAEGEVVVGAPRPVNVQRTVARLWKRDFPNITLKLSPAGTGNWPTRIKTERAAGKYLWDVYFSGPSVPIFGLAKTLFDPVRPILFHPDVNNPDIWGGWDAAFLDPDQKLFSMWNTAQSLFYNADKVSPEKVKKLGLKILLEPEAGNGKIAWQDPRGRGPGINPTQLIYQVLGEDALKKVFVDQEPVFYRRAATALENVVRGKHDFYLASHIERDMGPYRKAGLKLNFRPIGMHRDAAFASTGSVMIGLIKDRPHPNAAKLFINWVLTKRIAEPLSKGSRASSRRNDVAPYYGGMYAPLPGVKYRVFQREEFQAERRMLQKKLRAWRPN